MPCRREGGHVLPPPVRPSVSLSSRARLAGAVGALVQAHDIGTVPTICSRGFPMDCFNLAYDALNKIETSVEHLTDDQKLARAQVLALLSISQELSSIYRHGINPEFTDVS